MTVPSGLTTPFSLASASIEVSRGCSSLLTMTGSPFFCAMLTEQISRSKKPLFCAATAFSCDASAMRSCASRSILNCSATFSAVSGIESTPYCVFISVLTKRQPMVVS